MAGMWVYGSAQTSCVEKAKDGLEPIASGGSFVSVSRTFAPVSVTVQMSVPTKSLVGSSVQVVGPPLTVAACVPLTVHEIVNHGSVTFTGSEKVMEIEAPSSTFAAPSAGVVDVTVGATSPLVRGFGAAAVKSAAL